MGKKKRSQKKSGKGGGFFSFFGAAFKVCFRLLPVVALGAAFGGLFIGVRDALYADPNLSIQAISVSPSDALLPEQRQLIENKWMGKSIMSADLASISKSLEKDPGIQSALVTKQLPAKLSIEIVRRQPIACIQLAPQGPCGLISSDGVILSVIPAKSASGPMIEAFETGIREPKMGARLEVRGFNDAAAFIKKLEEVEFIKYEPVSRIGIDRLGSVNMTLGDGPQIRLGRRPLETLKSLEKIVPLLKREERSKIEYVDLQFDNVIVKRKR